MAKIIDKLAWIELQNGKILSARSKGKSVFYIPGGKREMGESDAGTLCREIREELNVELLPGTMRFLGVFEAQADGHPDGVLVKMTCYQARYTGVLKASSEIEEFTWLGYKDREDCPPVDKLIFDFLKKNGMLAD